jgi:probable biosynthetic protein (TIGR04098 family)
MRRDIGPLLIGMPQLGPYGLSENWLLRHLGDLHWQIICEGLGELSRDIRDEQGHRLYASFIRVMWSATQTLSRFGESDSLSGTIKMVRYGDGLFDSESTLQVAGASLSVRMVSLFSRREKEDSNERLLPATPLVPAGCAIPDLELVPPFVSDHRLLRTGRLATLELRDERFDVAEAPTETVRYPINGYFDFNGANLLYFASYPTIADICLSQGAAARSIGFERFVTRYSPVARDIFYFGNAELNDSIDCAVISHADGTNRLRCSAGLTRASDGLLIARQFVLRDAG